MSDAIRPPRKRSAKSLSNGEIFFLNALIAAIHVCVTIRTLATNVISSDATRIAKAPAPTPSANVQLDTSAVLTGHRAA
eukprot:scaffold274449_cov18-Prasinocladus_malaysianus.AAC.1